MHTGRTVCKLSYSSEQSSDLLWMKFIDPTPTTYIYDGSMRVPLLFWKKKADNRHYHSDTMFRLPSKGNINLISFKVSHLSMS